MQANVVEYFLWIYEKVEEFKVQNCFLLRQILTTLITVLSGGIAGLFFAQDSSLKYLFIPIGIFFLIIFVKTFQKNNIELNGYLYKGRALKK